MKLQYDRTVDDYVAFSRLLSKRSPRVRKRRLIAAGFVGTALLAIQSAAATQSVFISFGLSLFATLVFYFWIPLMAQSATRSAAKSNKKVVGLTEIAVLPDGIVGRKGHHEFKTFWDGVGNIVVDGERTFIYIDEDTAHIIPHKRITAGSYALFMQELARHIEAHTLAPLAATASSSPSLSIIGSAASTDIQEAISLRQQ